MILDSCEIPIVQAPLAGGPSTPELAAAVTNAGGGRGQRAAAAGADLLVVQGYEAGGHRGGTSDAPEDAVGLIALLQLITARVATPVVATGGIATGEAVAAVLCLGARAAALGTAFLDCPEAATAPVHRSALHDDVPTRLTRAFSGRTARGIENGFLRAHSESAPAAYPEVHHLTSPMRKAARQAGLADYVNLWAGQAYPLTAAAGAADLVRDLWAQAQAALGRLSAHFPQP
jgi:nitronate monooxygenase